MKNRTFPLFPMTTVTQSRGLFLPYRQTPNEINEADLVVENDFARFEIKTLWKKSASDKSLVAITKPNQISAAIIEAILKNCVNTREVGDGSILISFSPYTILKELQGSGSKDKKSVSNHTWLYNKLEDLASLRVNVKLKQKNLSWSAPAIITKIIRTGSDDEKELRQPKKRRVFHRVAPIDIRAAKEGEYVELETGDVCLWAVQFSSEYVNFFMSEAGVSYPQLLPVLNSMSGEAAGIARYCLSHNFVSGVPVIDLLKDLGARVSAASTARRMVSKVKGDAEQLEKCGISLQVKNGVLCATYNKKIFDPNRKVITFVTTNRLTDGSINIEESVEVEGEPAASLAG
jgi:hypothetical protein